MKMVRTIVNILSLAFTAAAALLLLAFTAAPTVFGYRTYVVLSGSMEPAIHTGAVVVAQPVPPTSLKVGDVIVYNRSDADERITHRIVDIKDADAGRPTFTTKGDANGAPDPWTVQYPTNTAGKVVFSVPYVGYLDAALESPQGRLAFIIIPVVVLSGMWLWQIWRPNKPAEQAPAAPAAVAPSAPSTPRPLAAAQPHRSSNLQPLDLKSHQPSKGTGLPLRH
ncbi:MAG TPA: signal peptidase I [Chloroflexota bacterium]|nr:signal peptidase I [Chloroflexota bacterium]